MSSGVDLGRMIKRPDRLGKFFLNLIYIYICKFHFNFWCEDDLMAIWNPANDMVVVVVVVVGQIFRSISSEAGLQLSESFF